MRIGFVAALLGGFFVAPALADDALMPRVQYLTKEQIQAYMCPQGNCLEVVAFYDKRSKTIVLRDTFDPTKEYDLSILLHEFVHHLQNLNRYQRSRCVGEEEDQAYSTQRAFLKSRGHQDTDEVMGIDMFTQKILSLCEFE